MDSNSMSFNFAPLASINAAEQRSSQQDIDPSGQASEQDWFSQVTSEDGYVYDFDVSDMDEIDSEGIQEVGKGRKSRAGQPLMRWSPGVDQHVLLAVEYVTRMLKIDVRWDLVAQCISTSLTPDAIKQHLAKVHARRQEDGLPVPEDNVILQSELETKKPARRSKKATNHSASAVQTPGTSLIDQGEKRKAAARRARARPGISTRGRKAGRGASTRNSKAVVKAEDSDDGYTDSILIQNPDGDFTPVEPEIDQCHLTQTASKKQKTASGMAFRALIAKDYAEPGVDDVFDLNDSSEQAGQHAVQVNSYADNQMGYGMQQISSGGNTDPLSIARPAGLPFHGQVYPGLMGHGNVPSNNSWISYGAGPFPTYRHIPQESPPWYVTDSTPSGAMASSNLDTERSDHYSRPRTLEARRAILLDANVASQDQYEHLQSAYDSVAQNAYSPPQHAGPSSRPSTSSGGDIPNPLAYTPCPPPRSAKPPALGRDELVQYGSPISHRRPLRINTDIAGFFPQVSAETGSLRPESTEEEILSEVQPGIDSFRAQSPFEPDYFPGTSGDTLQGIEDGGEAQKSDPLDLQFDGGDLGTTRGIPCAPNPYRIKQEMFANIESSERMIKTESPMEQDDQNNNLRSHNSRSWPGAIAATAPAYNPREIGEMSLSELYNWDTGRHPWLDDAELT